jgi:hypothetical protein
LFESIWAKIFGVKPQPGSGNKWFAPMDVGDGSILWNLKHSERGILRFDTYRVRDLMREAQDATESPNVLPGVATSEDGEQFVILRAEDFVRLCETGEYRYITPSRAEIKRQRGNIPALLRDEG